MHLNISFYKYFIYQKETPFDEGLLKKSHKGTQRVEVKKLSFSTAPLFLILNDRDLHRHQ